MDKIVRYIVVKGDNLAMLIVISSIAVLYKFM